MYVKLTRVVPERCLSVGTLDLVCCSLAGQAEHLIGVNDGWLIIHRILDIRHLRYLYPGPLV